MALIDDYRNIDANTIEALSNLQRIINQYENNIIANRDLAIRGYSERAIDEAAQHIANSQGISFEDAKTSIMDNPEYIDKITGFNPIRRFIQQPFTDVPGLKDALYTTRGILNDKQREALAKFLETSTAFGISKALPGAQTISHTDTWKNMSNMEQLVYLNEFVKKFKENPELVEKNLLQGHSGRQAVRSWEGDLIGFKQRQKPETKRTDEKPKEETAVTQDITPKQSEEQVKEQAKQDRIQDLALQLANLKAASAPSNVRDLASYTPKWWGAV